MSRRASLPGADELFRRTGDRPRDDPRAGVRDQRRDEPRATEPAAPPSDASARRGPKHDEKVTFYCTRDDLTALERTRLALRSDYGIAADRGRIVRAALAYVLEDFEARADDSILLRRLRD